MDRLTQLLMDAKTSKDNINENISSSNRYLANVKRNMNLAKNSLTKCREESEKFVAYLEEFNQIITNLREARTTIQPEPIHLEPILITFDDLIETVQNNPEGPEVEIRQTDDNDFVFWRNVDDDKSTMESLHHAFVMECHYFIQFMRQNELLVTYEDLFCCLELIRQRFLNPSLNTGRHNVLLYILKDIVFQQRIEWCTRFTAFLDYAIDHQMHNAIDIYNYCGIEPLEMNKLLSRIHSLHIIHQGYELLCTSTITHKSAMPSQDRRHVCKKLPEGNVYYVSMCPRANLQKVHQK